MRSSGKQELVNWLLIYTRLPDGRHIQERTQLLAELIIHEIILIANILALLDRWGGDFIEILTSSLDGNSMNSHNSTSTYHKYLYLLLFAKFEMERFAIL